MRGKRFVAGDSLTMGDIPVGTLCYRYHALGVERAPLANLEAWYERLESRGAFRRHVMSKEIPMPTKRPKAPASERAAKLRKRIEDVASGITADGHEELAGEGCVEVASAEAIELEIPRQELCQVDLDIECARAGWFLK